MTYAALLRCGAACALLGLLAACGGGGGGTSPTTQDPVLPGPSTPDNPVPRTTTGLRGAAIDLLDDWVPNDVATYTALAAVPTTGSAAYSGFVYGDLSNDRDAVTDSLIGRLSLNVAFSAASAGFTGSATGFVDSQDDPLSGSLAVSGGALNRNGNSASDATVRGIALAGVLRDGGNLAYDVGIQLEGDFLGTTAQAIGGEAIGRVSVGGDSQNFDGGFVAAQ